MNKLPKAFVKQVSISDWVTVQELNGYYIVSTMYLNSSDGVSTNKQTYATESKATEELIKAGECLTNVGLKLTTLESIRRGIQP